MYDLIAIMESAAARRGIDVSGGSSLSSFKLFIHHSTVFYAVKWITDGATNWQ